MTPDEQNDFTILGQATEDKHILTLRIAPMEGDFMAAHWRCLDNGWYTLIDVVVSPVEKALFRVFKLTDAGKERVALLRRMQARAKLVDASGNTLQ